MTRWHDSEEVDPVPGKLDDISVVAAQCMRRKG